MSSMHVVPAVRVRCGNSTAATGMTAQQMIVDTIEIAARQNVLLNTTAGYVSMNDAPVDVPEDGTDVADEARPVPAIQPQPDDEGSTFPVTADRTEDLPEVAVLAAMTMEGGARHEP